MKHDKTGQFEISQSSLGSAVVRCQILGGHTVNRDVGYGVHSYINLKILGGHVPVRPPYRYGPTILNLGKSGVPQAPPVPPALTWINTENYTKVCQTK